MTTFDCCMFYNENDLFELRINEHWNSVDKFIVVEAGETHTGLKKPLNFDHQRFAQYKEKIIYRSFDSFEDTMALHPELIDSCTLMDRGNTRNSADWTRDHFQGNYMLHVLRTLNANANDIVYMSCCDEILRPEVFSQCRDFISNSESETPVMMFKLWLYAYKFNLLSKTCYEADTTGMMSKFSTFDKSLPATLREFRTCTHIADDAGYHFTYADNSGGMQVLGKHKSWAHSRDIVEGEKIKHEYNQDSIQEAINHVINGYHVNLVNITPATHPKYLIDNLEKFDGYIFKNS